MSEQIKTPVVWSSAAPTAPGAYWFYGDINFGEMGGNYTGSVRPVVRLEYVVLLTTGSGLMAVAGGRFVPMQPFNEAARRPGYLGVWSPVALPELPTEAGLPVLLAGAEVRVP